MLRNVGRSGRRQRAAARNAPAVRKPRQLEWALTRAAPPRRATGSKGRCPSGSVAALQLPMRPSQGLLLRSRHRRSRLGNRKAGAAAVATLAGKRRKDAALIPRPPRAMAVPRQRQAAVRRGAAGAQARAPQHRPGPRARRTPAPRQRQRVARARQASRRRRKAERPPSLRQKRRLPRLLAQSPAPGAAQAAAARRRGRAPAVAAVKKGPRRPRQNRPLRSSSRAWTPSSRRTRART
mmetsp:Transcript_11022/g.25282  ORF Transcript_11022/g.25282 Transcript_11022/m.25282 type:complete len:237 (-) Transcript_11022:186-896(-)